MSLPRFSLPFLQRNPAPGLFRRLPLGLKREWTCMVSQTMLPDARVARDYATHLAQIKAKTAEMSLQLRSLEDSAMLDTLAGLAEQAILASLAKAPPGACKVGMSSGMDCRLIYAVARKHGIPLSTFTFGAPGYSDFEWPVFAGIVDPAKHRLFNVNTHPWSLAFFDRWTSEINDIPVSPRIPAIFESSLTDPETSTIYEVSGYFNGPRISLLPRKEPENATDWEGAIQFLIRYNDNFDFLSFFDPAAIRKLYPRKPFLPMDALPCDHQSFLSYREHQRIRPTDFGPIRYLLPYLDETWTEFWLNAPAHFFGETSVFNRMLARN